MMGTNPNGYGWMWNGYQANSSLWMGMFVMMILLIAAVGFGIWFVVRATRTAAVSTVSAESPRAILDRRFASGEIDAEEYAAARRVLQSPGTPRSR